MARKTGAEWAAKWKKRTNAAGEEMRDGINAVSEAPGQKAAAKADKMLAGITEAITSGKWAKRVASVTLEEWRDAMLNKGVGRVSAGVENAMPKMAEIGDRLLTAVYRQADRVNAMDDTSFEARLNKMVEFARGMHDEKISG